MTAAAVLLLLAVAVTGALAAWSGSVHAGTVRSAALVVGAAVLLAAAAVIALAAPTATGFALAAGRVAAVIAAMAGGSAVVTCAFTLAGATGQRRARATGPRRPRETRTRPFPPRCGAASRSACWSGPRSRCACSRTSPPGSR